MSNQEAIVSGAVEAHNRGEIISDLQARVIASEWHGGSDEGVTAFSHTGAIVERVFPELETMAVRYHVDDDMSLAALGALSAYIRHHGERPKVAGWSQLNW